MTTIMLQTWESVSFLHWPVPAAMLRPLIPDQLEIQTFEGTAWVSLVPFLISNLRLRYGPAVPWLSTFPETNVRTYVCDGKGREGVWFFSLDADRLLAVLGARSGFFLPYFWSRMRIHNTRYLSNRVWPGPPARSDIEVEPGEPCHVTERDRFLTDRFRLFTNAGGRLMYSDIEHPPWPLRHARLLRLEETLVAAAGIQRPADPPLVHFADRVDVRFSYLHWS